MNWFPPFNKEDLKERGIDQLDFVYVCGDAYVDHSSFGAAIITRTLEAHGYSVGLICQPDFRDEKSITVLGTPRLGFLVSAGNMDSMVNHYTVALKKRKTDAYSPGGEMGRRPDYATIVYCNLIRKVYKHEPIIVGGIEASLRRLGHYDYWSNKVRRSILLDSGADIISYGMGEVSIVEIADALASGLDVADITFINGTVFKTRNEENIYDAIKLPSFEEIKTDKKKYAESFSIQYRNTDPFNGKRLYETYDGSLYVVQNPPSRPLTQQEFDDVYEREYLRAWHPSYDAAGGIPAFNEIKYSITSNRGCFGECNFCALTFHQGRIIQSRSHDSIIREAKVFLEEKDFKGYIHDVGGPTAQFRKPACKKQMKVGACPNKKCLHPEVCKNMEVDHSDYLSILKKLRGLPGVKKVFVRSGIRFDYLLADKDDTFLRELCKHHISGQLRVAPEHISDNVLEKMGKPKVKVYDRFIEKFDKVNKQIGLQQYAVPYLMSSHPGSTLKDAIALAEYLCKHRLSPEQVQDFYPTPGTVSTCMYYTGIDPLTMEPVYVARDPHEKAMQRALIQFRRPENYDLVKEALLREHREDLIGFGPQFLIPPRKSSDKPPVKASNNNSKHTNKNTNKNAPKANRSNNRRKSGRRK
ncbi:YgiQ family radical SAM protein [Butyrivibrio sp. XPD2002]|uniref:YgiQ family radical SAM protein n=1 Tax=Butyrivibrio sp. XPD2002 TaxID=1280665 RepID=UPI00041B6F20|nr:YgiQ family radical SAM protein [Butyrivibrio sp. XPD2002]